MPSPPAPPSHFVALLRRSKFASYDPKIQQVYATFGGDAHRGNWGLKRPLPLRRRGANVTISAVDSKYKQTEWKSAEQETRWTKMWAEVGIDPTIYESGSWGIRLGAMAGNSWLVDSEFGSKKDVSPAEAALAKVLQSSDLYGPLSSAVPNIQAMSPKTFETYLRRLRKLRPAFQEFAKKALSHNPEGFTSLWQTSLNPGLLHKKFIESQAFHRYNAPGSRIIEQQPHRNAGLLYSKHSQLQSLFFNKPQKGRLLDRNRGELYTAGFAGMTAKLNPDHRQGTDVVDWDTLASTGMRNTSRGVTDLRIREANLVAAPNVVGRAAAGIKALRLETFVRSVAKEAMTQSNPHPPGSPEYVAHDPSPKQVPSMIPMRPSRKKSQQASSVVTQEVQTEQILVSLKGIMLNIKG